ALELIAKLEQLTRGLREATQFTNAVVKQSHNLLGGSNSPQSVSSARAEAIVLNYTSRQQPIRSKMLLERSHEMSGKLLSPLPPINSSTQSSSLASAPVKKK